MKSIFWRAIKDKKIQLLIIIASALAFLEMYIALFPTLQKQASQMTKLLESYPDSFFKAFNIDKASLTFEKVGSYLAMEQFNFIWPILAVVLAISFANYAFAYEKERGTIELILSQPISRTKIFLAKYATGVVAIISFSLISILAIIPLTKLHGVDVSIKGVFILTGLSILFAWAIYGLAFFASVVFKEKSKATFLIGGVLLLMFVLKIVAGLKESLEFLKYLSFFHYYDPTLAIDKLNVVSGSLLMFAGSIIITFIIALLWFNKQDVISY
jgi:ABC-2 type transport system permease protein